MNAMAAIVHHLAAFTMISALAAQFVLLGDPRRIPDVRTLSHLDIVYAAAATTVLVFGLWRVFRLEKGWDYYSHSIPFWIKISAFVFVAIISIGPTRKFLAWTKARKADSAFVADPAECAGLRRTKSIELASIALILANAALMARGFWTF